MISSASWSVLLLCLLSLLNTIPAGCDSHFRSLVRSRTVAHARTHTHSKLFTAANMEAFNRALLAQQEKVRAGGEPECGGLIKQMCKACPDGGPDDFCKNTNKMCGDLFCSPMCRRQTWNCNIDFGTMTEESEDPSYEKALCAQFIAQGCQKILDCCANNAALYDFVENWAFQDKYPDTRLPSISCVTGPTDDLCNKCKAAVKVKLEAVEDCPYPKIEEDSFIETWERARERDSDQASPIMMPVIAALGQPREWSAREHRPSFITVTEWAGVQPTGFKDGMFPGPPAHKAPQERCTKLLAKVKAKFGEMESAFQENACGCLGCCKGSCFYPLTENFPADPDAPGSK